MESFDSFIYNKSKKFALRVINLYRYLHNERHEYVMSDQILRAGTSIGANISEAKYAQSKADLISKLSIARKEANETKYWLDLLSESSHISNEAYISISNDCIEIVKILTSAILTLKDHNNQSS